MTNRIIKFRAWVNMAKTGRMYPNVGFLNGVILNPKSEVINKAIIMQFTGLLDKNGKEIYEGDIVTYGKGGSLHRMEVYFSNGRFVPTSKGKHGKREFEVIGNIYQNPELLK